MTPSRSLLTLALVMPVSTFAPAPASIRAEPPGPAAIVGDRGEIQVTESADEVRIETDALVAVIRKKGYVSGIAAGSFLDKKTGARDLGFGSHIMDFLMASGWRDDGYERNSKLHGEIPKHYVEGPQICTQAKQLPVEIVRGDGFVAVRLKYAFHQPGRGYQTGSVWEQTLVFRPSVRYVLSAERITSVNSVDNLFYRIDMPGHLRHGGERGPAFEQIYLSYRDTLIPAAEFEADFGPDERFLYQRREDEIPRRMIRAYQVRHEGRPGPWFTGMTLDPAAVSEAWCHQRSYVCFIQELHGRAVKAGESFGAAYIVGWFDDIPEMHTVYDKSRGVTGIAVQDGQLTLVK